MFSNPALLDELDGLRKFACRLTHNDIPEAEDLLQSTVLRAIEKKHLFQDGTNLFSWASKIMFNLFVTQYRRKTRFETQYDPESYIEAEKVEASQEEQLEMKNMMKALEEVSGDHREILVMVCVQGMQYAEVAHILSVPVGTVRSRLSRAREALQNKMNETKAQIRYVPRHVPAAHQIAMLAA